MSRFVVLCALGVLLFGCDALKDAAVEKVESGKEQMVEATAQEAEMNLRAIGNGAQTYFQADHPSKDGLSSSSMVFPKSNPYVCSEGGDPKVRVSPTETNWHAEPWSSLRFSMTAPHAFMFCYESSRDQKKFAAWAEAGDRAYCITGVSDGGQPRLSPIRDLGAEGKCILP
ncbi:MAG: hypothetical protein AUK47_20225 [Deltaproteobacteria bacterium CG2_30_63_29]|nr:MAG: hypothetical protein AUK47_20225 [Deltaproteobacteria bacterium CG2_30_63_29]PJB35838.1 MAG: hypothetical protein CO108_24705 [Deltaproteobacteria bacterium CG_4_9_14_3_um_filter_63_12]